MYGRRCKNALHRTFCFMQEESICALPLTPSWKESLFPDTFFSQIDKMNAVLKEHGGEGTEIIDYVQYIKDAIARAEKNAPVRKSDLKTLKKK